jgi:hypothetical protein
MENRNEMDFNPYDWTKIKNDTPLLSKLWSVLKYHITDDKTFSVKLETLHYVLCPLWHKFFTYYHGDQLVFWFDIWDLQEAEQYDRELSYIPAMMEDSYELN